jgi:RNA polymerase sigma-70 factor (ECF subfamily)
MLSVMFRGAVEDIADAEQEVFAALYTGLGRFRFDSSVRTFLYRLCRNTAIDMIRRERRARGRIRAAARAAAGGQGPAALRVVDPDDELERNERRREVSAALFSLPRDERLLVLMKDCEDMSVGEIAGTLGIPEGTVKSRLHRTREKLARLLGGL